MQVSFLFQWSLRLRAQGNESTRVLQTHVKLLVEQDPVVRLLSFPETTLLIVLSGAGPDPRFSVGGVDPFWGGGGLASNVGTFQ